MAFYRSSQVHGESQIAQTIGLDELPTNSQSQQSQREPNLPWGRLFPLNFLFGDSPHSLWENLITVGRAEDCSIVLEKTKESSRGKILTDAFYKAYSKLHFQLTRNSTSTGCFTFIEDCSSNGTYVNGCKLGKGSKQFLSNNDEIAICDVKNRLFVYMETVDEKENIQMPKEIDEQFTIGKILGTGAYGEVRLGFHKTTCRRVAVKIINKDQLGGVPTQSQETVDEDTKRKGLTPTLQTKREIEILRAISHPCVVSVEAVAESALAFYVVLELAEGGDLHTRLRNSKEPIGEKLAKIFFLQIASAVDYLHRAGVTHRDLKPENILLMTLDRITVCKVTDFGLAKLASTMSSMTTFCGTPLFVAPEIIVAQGNSSYTSAVDLWALGVLLYLCLVSELPFRDGRGDLPLSQQILRGSYAFPSPRWASISSSAKDLIRQFLQVNPSRRLTAGDALHVEWLDDDDAKALVDNLVHAPRPESPILHLMAKPLSSERQGRSVTPTVVESSDEARTGAAGVGGSKIERDGNGNRLNQSTGRDQTANDRPVETVVAATNHSLKRRSACLHQSSSGESGDSHVADGCGPAGRDKRCRIDP